MSKTTSDVKPLPIRIVCLCVVFLCILPFIFMSIPTSTEDDTPATEPTESTVATTVPSEPSEPSEPPVTEPIETEPAETIPPTEPPTEPPTTQSTEPPTEPPTETQPPKYYDVPLSNDLQDFIFELCAWRKIDPAIIIAMIKKESNYNAGSIGDRGDSFGLMMIQPKWHQDRMDAMGVTDLLDPYQNVNVGISLFADYYDASGSVEWALMVYNGGRKQANNMTANGQVTKYVTSVFAIMESLERRN